MVSIVVPSSSRRRSKLFCFPNVSLVDSLCTKRTIHFWHPDFRRDQPGLVSRIRRDRRQVRFDIRKRVFLRVHQFQGVPPGIVPSCLQSMSTTSRRHYVTVMSMRRLSTPTEGLKRKTFNGKDRGRERPLLWVVFAIDTHSQMREPR